MNGMLVSEKEEYRMKNNEEYRRIEYLPEYVSEFCVRPACPVKRGLPAEAGFPHRKSFGTRLVIRQSY